MTRAAEFTEVEFYGGPWDGRRLALRLPLAPSFGVPCVRPLSWDGAHCFPVTCVQEYQLEQPADRAPRYRLVAP